MVLDSLPDRPLTFNEKESLAARYREATPLRNPFGPNDEPSIHAFTLITAEKLYALYYDTDEGWECIYREDTPEGAFAGDFITNEDHNHDAVQNAFDALKERDEE